MKTQLANKQLAVNWGEDDKSRQLSQKFFAKAEKKLGLFFFNNFSFDRD